MKKKIVERIRVIVREVIYSWKPFSWGPDDINDPEFNGEVNAIVRQVGRMESERDTAAVISRIFTSSFSITDGQFSEENCQDVGARLFRTLKSQNLI